jgi:hypothetical protein
MQVMSGRQALQLGQEEHRLLRESPHISRDGCRLPQTFGRPGCPKIRQPLCSSSCTQRTPAGLPFGMPGIGELIEGAMQQAPQPGRQR